MDTEPPVSAVFLAQVAPQVFFFFPGEEPTFPAFEMDCLIHMSYAHRDFETAD